MALGGGSAEISIRCPPTLQIHSHLQHFFEAEMLTKQNKTKRDSHRNENLTIL